MSSSQIETCYNVKYAKCKEGKIIHSEEGDHSHHGYNFARRTCRGDRYFFLLLVSVALCSSAGLQSPRAAQWHLRGRAQSCVASWTQGESRPTLPKPAGRLSQGQAYRPVNVANQAAWMNLTWSDSSRSFLARALASRRACTRASTVWNPDVGDRKCSQKGARRRWSLDG
jgi:hypothetical protein